VLRRSLLALADRNDARDLVTRAPISRAVVDRFIAGDSELDAVRAARQLADGGLAVTVDRLGEHVTERTQAEDGAAAYESLLGLLADAGLADRCEVSLKLSAVGQGLPDGEALSTDLAHRVCEAAAAAGTTVTLDMEDHTTTDATLATAAQLWADHPRTGVVLQAMLHRTEADCRDLAGRDVRVRLCKGAYDEPSAVAYTDRRAIDRAYVRCLALLMAGRSFPMVATHDPRLIEVAAALAIRHRRQQGGYEFQMLYGVRAQAQQQLADEGETVRVYLPYGDDWWGYMVRRMAEKPANLGLFLRAVLNG
jgi:proline dehydrogenase